MTGPDPAVTPGRAAYEAFQKAFPSEDWGPWDGIEVACDEHAGWEAIAAAGAATGLNELRELVAEILGEFKPGSPPVTSWHAEARISEDRIAGWRERAGLEG